MRGTKAFGWLRGAWISVLERRRARQVCRELMCVYGDVRAADASLAGEPLYAQIIARYKHSDARQAKELLDHAEQSYAQWPLVRNLVFRDVALFLVVSESLTASEAAGGVRTDLADIVNSAIPAEL